MDYVIKPVTYKEKIDYALPKNYEPQWSHKFNCDNSQIGLQLGVKVLNNVFVNHYGLVIKNGLLVKGCAPNIGFIKYDDDNFYWHHWRKAIEQAIISKYGRSIEYLYLDDDINYLLIHSPWFSYYFWISECVPRLLLARNILAEVTLLYPEAWKKFPFVDETLKLFPELKIRIVPSDIHLRIKTLYMPEVKPWTPMFIPEIIKEVRSFFYSKFDIREKHKNELKRIYISRRGTIKKNFINEDHIDSILKEFAFESVRMEDLSFREQVNLMSESKVMLGITGAGHINQLFMPKQSALFDVTNCGYLKSDIYKFHYWRLSNILGIDYYTQFCEYENSNSWPDFSFENLKPDMNIFQKNLELIIENEI